MHAKIENFPQFAAVIDSLRAIYPELLIFSAGDNRTGEPLNDLYEIPAYPMVALMNQIGFDATTLGNHEYDGGQANLAKLINLSNFPYLACNIIPDPKWGINVLPYKMFFVNELRIAVIGATQVGPAGHPDTHPDNCTDILFTPVEETLQEYKWLRDESDVVIVAEGCAFAGGAADGDGGGAAGDLFIHELMELGVIDLSVTCERSDDGYRRAAENGCFHGIWG